MADTVTIPTEATDEIADFLEYNIISEDVDWFWKELLKIATARTPPGRRFAGAKMTQRQPQTIPNPLYCERCEGRGYLVADAEWEPIAVQCHDCMDRRPPKESK